MIEKLEYRPDIDRWGNQIGLLPPSNGEIITKLNEVVEVLNHLLEILEEKK